MQLPILILALTLLPGTGDGQLKLPKAPRADPPPAPVENAPPSKAPLPNAPPTPQPAISAGEFVFQELARVREPSAGLRRRAAESLMALGEAGLVAARAHLVDEAAPSVALAGHVLLKSGQAADADLVVHRLTVGRLPGGAGPALLAELVAADPVRATPQLYATLLDHPQPALRRAAARELGRTDLEKNVAALETAYSSTRADTRLAAIELAGHANGQEASKLLLDALDDASPRIVAAAASALATRADPRLDGQLIELAFAQPWVLRPGACALLAIVAREDARLEPILGDEHREPLLAALSARDPFVAGSAAAALAGIGFRSQSADPEPWLAREVPDRLVESLAARSYQPDLVALAPAAARRLELLSGQPLGPDGAAWGKWWLEAANEFQPRRAALAFGPGEEARIALTWRGAGDQRSIVLLGPALADTLDAQAEESDAILLSAAEARDLVAGLAAEGVLSAERLPGQYGVRSERSLTIAVGARSKSFHVGLRGREPWFDRCGALARSLAAANRWQSLRPGIPARAPSAHLVEEGPWWSEPRSQAERDARLFQLALAAARNANPNARELALVELERTAAAGAAHAAAFEELLTLALEEDAPGPRMRRLGALALACAGTHRDAAARTLANKLDERHGAAARDALAAVLAECARTPADPADPNSLARSLATDPRANVRAAAADALAHAPSEQDATALLALLADPEPAVQCAAAQALGAARVEAGRAPLLSLARLGSGQPRCAALRAAGKLGGEWVLDALVLGLADQDPLVQRAAAEGLGNLGDPAAARVLVPLLEQERDGSLRSAARIALVALGDAALPALRESAERPRGAARREAALALAELGSPDAVAPLLALLTENPDDARIATELAILTCVDARGATNPLDAWWSWWEGVRHDDAHAWFVGALQRLSIAQPPPEENVVEQRLYLLALLEREEAWLVERARRELARAWPDADLHSMPPPGEDRKAWVRAARARVESGR